MTTTSLSSVLGILAESIRPHHGQGQSLDGAHLNRHALDDLNLPPDFRSRIEMNRDTAIWDRIGGWRTL